MPPGCRHLFVYGTLRRASPHPMARFLEQKACWLGPASAPGRLYDLGPFPGMTEAQSDQGRVQGDVYELPGTGQTLAELDRYEGCACAEEELGPFTRRAVPVRLASGEELTAWVYFYGGPVWEGQRIASGDWINERLAD